MMLRFLLVLWMGVAAAVLDTSLSQNTAGFLETLSSIREESVAVREESVAVREESIDIREEARDVREEARDVREEAREVREQAYDMRDSTRALDSSLVEAISLVMEAFHKRNQSQVYMKQIRDGMMTLIEKVDRLEGKVDGFEEKAASGKIEALSVSSSAIWLNRGDLGPAAAVDGNMHTQLHTECASNQWFKMNFSGTCRVDRIVLINGKTNIHIWRLNQSPVYVIGNDGRNMLCGKVQVREGTTIESQTYTLECSLGMLPMVGVGVMVRNVGSNCLEIREFDVYGACTGQI